jgi:hypothetical protein
MLPKEVAIANKSCKTVTGISTEMGWKHQRKRLQQEKASHKKEEYQITSQLHSNWTARSQNHPPQPPPPFHLFT